MLQNVTSQAHSFVIYIDAFQNVNTMKAHYKAEHYTYMKWARKFLSRHSKPFIIIIFINNIIIITTNNNIYKQ